MFRSESEEHDQTELHLCLTQQPALLGIPNGQQNSRQMITELVNYLRHLTAIISGLFYPELRNRADPATKHRMFCFSVQRSYDGVIISVCKNRFVGRFGPTE